MSATKKKSKKRSGANSGKSHKQFPFFLDRSLGKHIIADALSAGGSAVHRHDDHLPPDAPDEDWIALVGRQSWVAITKDKNIRYRIAELQAIKHHSARVLVVRAKNATGEDIAQILLAAMTRIQKFANENGAPFVAGINRSGQITTYEI